MYQVSFHPSALFSNTECSEEQKMIDTKKKNNTDTFNRIDKLTDEPVESRKTFIVPLNVDTVVSHTRSSAALFRRIEPK